MISRIPGVGSISRLFSRPNSQHAAKAAMARILTQVEMSTMPFETGIRASRRDTETHRSAIGTWLLPFSEGVEFADLEMTELLPAVTSDLRQDGFGVMLTTQLQEPRAILAVPDQEGIWRFFVNSVRHCSQRPGGWYHAGLKIERLFEPTTTQFQEFRQRVLGNNPEAAAGTEQSSPAATD